MKISKRLIALLCNLREFLFGITLDLALLLIGEMYLIKQVLECRSDVFIAQVLVFILAAFLAAGAVVHDTLLHIRRVGTTTDAIRKLAVGVELFVDVVHRHSLFLEHILDGIEEGAIDECLVRRTVLVPITNLYFANIERIREHILNRLVVDRPRMLGYRRNIHVVRDLLLGPLASHGLLREPLLPSPLRELADTPLAGRIKLKDALDGGCTLRIERLIVRPLVEIPDWGPVDHTLFATKLSLRVLYLLANDFGEVRSEHAVHTHMKFAGAGILVVRFYKAHIAPCGFQTIDDIEIVIVTACPVHTQEDNALDLARLQQPHQRQEFRAQNPILNTAVVRDDELVLLFECRVALVDDAVGAEAGHSQFRH